MKQVILKLRYLPEQLHLSVNGHLVHDCPSILDCLNPAYDVAPLVGKILRGNTDEWQSDRDYRCGMYGRGWEV